MNDVVGPALTLGLLVLAFVVWVWYAKQVRKGRADPIVSPAWPSTMRPGSFNLAEPDPRDETSLFIDPDDPTRRDGGAGGPGSAV